MGPLLAVALALLGGCPQTAPGHDDEPLDAGSDGPETETDADRDAPDGDGERDADEDPPACGYPGSGYGLVEGTVLAPFDLWDCEGQRTSLPELWCGSRVTIIHFSTGWCTFCEQAAESLVDIVLEPLAGEPVAAFEVFFENDPGEVATTADCGEWQARLAGALPTYVPPDARLAGALADLTEAVTPPVAIVLDATGEIRMWDRIGAPQFIEENMQELLRTVERILEEP
jgi:thiol-disulfide isomerase/thioredoxin